MHYIIGTQITVPRSTQSKAIRPGMTSQQIKSMSSRSSEFQNQRAQFVSGETYSIIRIYMKDDQVCYRFGSTSGDITEVCFNSVSQADRFISELRSETVPDYESINRNKSD